MLLCYLSLPASSNTQRPRDAIYRTKLTKNLIIPIGKNTTKNQKPKRVFHFLRRHKQTGTLLKPNSPTAPLVVPCSGFLALRAEDKQRGTIVDTRETKLSICEGCTVPEEGCWRRHVSTTHRKLSCVLCNLVRVHGCQGGYHSRCARGWRRRRWKDRGREQNCAWLDGVALGGVRWFRGNV